MPSCSAYGCNNKPDRDKTSGITFPVYVSSSFVRRFGKNELIICSFYHDYVVNTESFHVDIFMVIINLDIYI